MTTASINESLLGRANSLNAVRFILAVAVLAAHTFSLGGFAWRPKIGSLELGRFAVYCFFAVSGYLICASRMRLSLSAFLWRRARRVLPAFWTCLVVTAFVISPLASVLSGESWRPLSAFRYILANFGVHISQYGIDSTLLDVPFPRAWNGSLWTLFWEILCYLMAGIYLSVSIVRRHSRLSLVVLLALVMAARLVIALAQIDPWMVGTGLELASFFAAGMVLFGFGDSLSFHPMIALSAVFVLLIGLAIDRFDELGGLPLAYLMLYAGASRRVSLGRRNDLSYGLYIYAFPMQQCLALADFQQFGAVAFFAASLLLTIPPAFLSWHFLERRLFNWNPRSSLTMTRV